MKGLCVVILHFGNYETMDTDILVAFRVTPQPGVLPEEVGAVVAVEFSTTTWTIVWTIGLTSLDRYPSWPQTLPGYHCEREA